MANYDVVGTFRLPVFNVGVVTTSPSPYKYSFNSPPVRAFPIKVYEFSGSVSELLNFNFNLVDGTEIPLALSFVKNTAPPVEGDTITMFIGDYSDWNVEPIYGYGLTLRIEQFGTDSDGFGFFYPSGQLGSSSRSPAQYALIYSPNYNSYFVVMQSANGTNALCPSSGSPIATIINYTGEETNPEDNPNPYIEGGTSSPSGGGGAFGKGEVSDPIDIPSGSAAGVASNTGLFTRYLVNSSYLDTLGDWLWATDLGLVIAKSVISTIYGNPADSVISLMSFPFDIKTLSGVTTKQQNLYWGNHNSGLSFIALTSNAATVDWGTITLEEYWGNFLDYEPHTKIELYLPWGTGFVSVDPNMCLPGTLRVVTNIDLSKGSCVHNVIGNNGSVIGSYAGQCSQQIPILANDYASKVAGVVVSATALAVAGAAGGAATNAALDAASSYRAANSYPIGDVAGMEQYIRGRDVAMERAREPHMATRRTASRVAATSSIAALRRSGTISRNGGFTDGSAALGVQYPYIILSRPSQSVPEQYGNYYGYPSNIYSRLNTITGYTEIGDIHLEGINATETEISELAEILKGGVIF